VVTLLVGSVTAEPPGSKKGEALIRVRDRENVKSDDEVENDGVGARKRKSRVGSQASQLKTLDQRGQRGLKSRSEFEIWSSRGAGENREDANTTMLRRREAL